MTSPTPAAHFSSYALWLGPGPSSNDESAFHSQGLSIVLHGDVHHLAAFSGANSLVVRYDPGAAATSGVRLRQLGKLAIAHGLRLCLYAPTETELPGAMTGAAKGLNVEVFFQGEEQKLATAAGSRPTASVANPVLHIKGATPAEEEDEVLLRRAFSDCEEVVLSKLSGGRSAEVFCCYALFSGTTGFAGRRPLPFFVKFDRLQKVNAEQAHYESAVNHFIPFNHRPNLEPSRTILGSHRGILVGTFIDHSESLAQFLARGSTPDPLFSLFEHALRGWRLQAYSTFKELKMGTSNAATWRMLQDPGWVRVGGFRAPNLQRAKQLGAKRDPADVLALLQSVDRFHFGGPIHADLHAHNVRVYNGQAIIIDFNAQNEGPIVADPALLEVSLVFAWHGEGDTATGWQEMVDKLYDFQNLEDAPPPAISPQPREWLWTAVRVIRTLSLPSARLRKEYVVALAIYLLRHAGFRPDSTEPQELERRAYAYVIAERLAVELAKAAATPATPVPVVQGVQAPGSTGAQAAPVVGAQPATGPADPQAEAEGQSGADPGDQP